MDGTVRKVNDNFRAPSWVISEGEVVGRHHSMFADAAFTAGGEYRAFLGQAQSRLKPSSATTKSVAKGGREVWLQSSYNPIPDANGKPVQGREVFERRPRPVQQAQLQLQLAVEQTQDTVRQAIDGDLTHRIPMAGKTGDLEALCRGINSLLESTADLVKRVKAATNEVADRRRGKSPRATRTCRSVRKEQASSLEETASSMEEMTSTVKQTADKRRPGEPARHRGRASRRRRVARVVELRRQCDERPSTRPARRSPTSSA